MDNDDFEGYVQVSHWLDGWHPLGGRRGQGKPSDVGEELGELVDGLQIPQHVQSESAKTHPIKGLETRQGLGVDGMHIEAFQWAENRGIRHRCRKR